MNIYETVMQLCAERKIDKTTLEQACGFSQNSINKWKGSIPSVDRIIKIADHFGVSVDYILGREGRSLSKKFLPIREVEDKDEIPYSTNPRIMQKVNVPYDLYEDKKGQFIAHINLQVNSQCPICHIGDTPRPVKFVPTDATKKEWVAIYQCRLCHHTYSVLYKEVKIAPPVFEYLGAQPLPSVDSCYTPYRSAIPDLPEAFNKPEFAKFRQAYEDLCWAKDYQIEGLIGMAYRRALECLIKDFLISEGYQTEYKNIPKEQPANLFQAMSNEIIEDCGRAANNLANDYVHYEDDNPNAGIAEIEELFNEVLEKVKDYIIHKKALRLFDPKHKELSKNKNKVLKNNSTEVLNKIAEENRDLFCEQRFIDSTKIYRHFPDDKRERVFAYILGIAIGLNLPLQQILGKNVI